MTSDAASSPLVLVNDQDGVRLLTLNRPEALNAFNQDLWYETTDALRQAATEEVRCVVLTGTGRAFTAGQDVNEMRDPSAFEDRPPGYEVFMPALEELPVPIIAAVNGIGVGLGLTVLLHCDLVYISTEARLKAPFITLGVTTEAAASYLLPKTVGWQRANELLYNEPWVSANDAVELGLALETCEPGALLDRALAQARHIAQLPPGPVRATKRVLMATRLDAIRAARGREMDEFEDVVKAMMQ